MHDSHIMMSGPMVLACLRQVRGEPGGKTQTRRMPTKQWDALERRFLAGESLRLWVRESGRTLSEPYDCDPVSGRDEWRIAGFQHAADGALVSFRKYDVPLNEWIGDTSDKSTPSIHMPRWASRLTLLDVTIRRERLGDISEADARAEGIAWQDPTADDLEWYRGYCEEHFIDAERNPMEGVWIVPGIQRPQPLGGIWGPTAASAYSFLWRHLYGWDSWERDADKEVMVIGFRPVLANIDQIGGAP